MLLLLIEFYIYYWLTDINVFCISSYLLRSCIYFSSLLRMYSRSLFFLSNSLIFSRFSFNSSSNVWIIFSSLVFYSFISAFNSTISSLCASLSFVNPSIFSYKHSMCSFICYSHLICILHSASSCCNIFSYSLWARGIDWIDDSMSSSSVIGLLDEGEMIYSNLFCRSTIDEDTDLLSILTMLFADYY